MMVSGIVLGCSGSVACIKVPDIVSRIENLELRRSVFFVPTSSATYFLPKSSDGQINITSNKLCVCVILPSHNISDCTLFDKIVGVVIAPLGANMMARLCMPFDKRPGTPSNLEIIIDMLMKAGKLASDTNIPFLVAPAMNPVMWNSVHTRSTIQRLKVIYGHNFHVLPTVRKASMCGEIGYGNMETPENIVRYLQEALNGTIKPIPEDLIDVPSALFDTVNYHALIPERTIKEAISLNFEDPPNCSALPYVECLQRVGKVLSMQPDETLNILVGTEESLHEIHSKHSPTWILLELFRKDLMEIAGSSVTKDHREPFATREKFVLAKKAHTSSGPSSTEETPAVFEEQTNFTDADEWQMWNKRGDPVLHILLRQWATVFVLVNPSPQVLQKIASGMCDNLLTSVARAWDFRKGFFVINSVTPGGTTENLDFLGIKCVRMMKDLAQ